MAEPFFTKAQQKQVTDAITQAELNTSGEIRLHIEATCKEDVLDRAAFIFKKLEMHKTELRNGVLFYLSVEDHKLAILGDGGINAKVPKNFWHEIKDHLISQFGNGKYAEGISEGIIMAGEQLKQQFPHQTDDVNELSNEISYGKNMGENE
ncbi:TPM domain-containing protein [Cryomorpha ignava]|uniref:TPM domain-containing protein n=1 Tax=Cryomorpha ignava TaxID=101383 RepID=A0A7K3WQF7_9FLAO|nr:TPM domain-containing protein [Cryomorpha ignava]NEN23786.1 TPM domain-containing protein [Cryomorpha ignava]